MTLLKALLCCRLGWIWAGRIRVRMERSAWSVCIGVCPHPERSRGPWHGVGGTVGRWDPSLAGPDYWEDDPCRFHLVCRKGGHFGNPVAMQLQKATLSKMSLMISSGYLWHPCRIRAFCKTINILMGKNSVTLGGFCQGNSDREGFVIQLSSASMDAEMGKITPSGVKSPVNV